MQLEIKHGFGIKWRHLKFQEPSLCIDWCGIMIRQSVLDTVVWFLFWMEEGKMWVMWFTVFVYILFTICVQWVAKKKEINYHHYNLLQVDCLHHLFVDGAYSFTLLCPIHSPIPFSWLDVSSSKWQNYLQLVFASSFASAFCGNTEKKLNEKKENVQWGRK